MSADDMRQQLKTKALSLGFDQFGIASADMSDAIAEGLKEFVGKNHHGTMEWLADRLHHHSSPKNLWPDARSVIMLAMNYGPNNDPRLLLEERSSGNISVYARGRDYHDTVKKRLKQMARWLVETYQCIAT